MSRLSNSRKHEFLGINYGTASSRLKKAIMLRLLQRLGDDRCFRCGDPITIPDDLTIDHKVDWLHVDPDLFWDLDNISFSHGPCNVAGRKNGGGQDKRIVGEAGTAWCSTCKAFKPEIDFSVNRNHWNGLNYECRVCKDKWR